MRQMSSQTQPLPRLTVSTQLHPQPCTDPGASMGPESSKPWVSYHTLPGSFPGRASSTGLTASATPLSWGRECIGLIQAYPKALK